MSAPFVTGVVLDCDGGRRIRQYADTASDPMRAGLGETEVVNNIEFVQVQLVPQNDKFDSAHLHAHEVPNAVIGGLRIKP